MIDKIYTLVIGLIGLLMLFEFIVPGSKGSTSISDVDINSGPTFNRYRMGSPYTDYIIYFDNYKRKARLSVDDFVEFSKGDSITYELTWVMGNLRELKNIRTGYIASVPTYTTLIGLVLAATAFQVINARWVVEQKMKDFIHIILFSLIFVIGFILYFK
jgi:hypothetical protein